MTCPHLNFESTCTVNRLTSGSFTMDVMVSCKDCRKPFQFLGLEPGSSYDHPTVSLSGLEARMPIAPMDSQPNPLQRMHGVLPLHLN